MLGLPFVLKGDGSLAGAIQSYLTYGLMLVDKIARVSNQEKNILMSQIIAKSSEKIRQDIHAQDAHTILDSI